MNSRLRFSSFVGPLLLVACTTAPTTPPPTTPEILFPPPPETARFVFERTIRSSADLAQEEYPGGWRQALTGERQTATALAKPFDVEACGGTVYVSDTVARRVFAFDARERRFITIGKDEPGRLHKPLGVATDRECNLYVADATLGQVVVYDRAGTHLRSLGGQRWFERLSHVAVTADGASVFAVDTGGVGNAAHRIRVFDGRSGAHLRDIGSRGRDAGQLNLPRDIALGADGAVYVVDGGNFRVQVFSQAGEPLREIGELGRLYGQFARPKGLALDAAGNVYVSDTSHGNFQIFDTEGNLLLFVGARSETPGPASYMLPGGIDVDEDGRVYLVDQYFKKIDVYRPAALSATDGLLGAWPVVTR